MDRTEHVLRGVLKVLRLVGAFLVLLLVLHVFVDVMMRNIFGIPLTGTIEFVSNVYMIGICFLPLALADERDAHISVEVLTERMPGAWVRVLVIIGTMLMVLVIGALLWRTLGEAITQYKKGAVMVVPGAPPLPLWPSYFLLPAGFALSLAVLLYKALCFATGRSFGPPADEAPAGLELIEEQDRR